MNLPFTTLILFIAPVLIALGGTSSLGALGRGMSYQEVKTWHQQFSAGNPTKAARLDALRAIVRASPYGEQGLRRIFRNFEGAYSIDPRIPGVEDSVLKLMSPSHAQAKGYVRETLYAMEFYNDPRFKLVAMNQKVQRSWGNTDADIIFRYGQRGIYGRIEVKDVSLRSQASDMRRIKGQIDKMAREYRRTGQLQAWVNRREVMPEIKQYANRKGIPVFEKVSTGHAKNAMSASEFKAEMARQSTAVQRARAFHGGFQMGYGIWMLWNSAPDTWADMQSIMDPNLRDGEAWRRFGEHGSFTLAGGAMTLSGGALIASQYASEALQGNLYFLGRAGGYVAIAALASGEGFMIYRYKKGDVSSREFWTSQWILGGSALGGMAGSWGGGALGGIIGGAVTDGPGAPVGASIGSGVGGLLGTWAGGNTTRYFASTYYDWRFAEMDRLYGEFVYSRYGVQ